MKLCNLIEELNNKEKFTVSSVTVISGNNAGAKRITLIREQGEEIILANSINDFYSYNHLIGKTVIGEVYKTKLPTAITENGSMKQMIGYLEEEICQK